MTNMLVQLKVKDFAAWRKVFDTASGMRTSNGELSDQIFQDASDPNKVTILYEWSSIADAQKYFQSPELKAALTEAGVQAPPDVNFMNKA